MMIDHEHPQRRAACWRRGIAASVVLAAACFAPSGDDGLSAGLGDPTAGTSTTMEMTTHPTTGPTTTGVDSSATTNGGCESGVYNQSNYNQACYQ